MDSEKENFLKHWEREFQTTMKVLKNYPEDKQDMKPGEKSKSAKELAWTFVGEEMVAVPGILKGEVDWKKMPKPPAKLREAISEFEKVHKQNVALVKKTPDDEFNKTTKWFVAPKTSADMRRMDLLWFVLMDQIHHRGQFSVYLRIVGAKVPSIYGPSADEPWM